MENLEKYRVVYRPSLVNHDDPLGEYMEKINALAEAGYRVHTFEHDYALMSLKSDSKYEEISNLRDVSPEEVDGLLAEGWTVTDSWSKTVRMVKKIES